MLHDSTLHCRCGWEMMVYFVIEVLGMILLVCVIYLLPEWIGALQPKEFETRVQVIQRYPEMKTVEKTDFVKEIHHEERTILVPKTRVIMDEVERIDRVPVVKKVPKIRIEITHRYAACYVY